MRVFTILAVVTLALFASSCTVSDDAPQKKYNFERCVEAGLSLSGSNPDDGDRHSAEMMCQPCQMPGAFRSCKKLIDELEGGPR